MGEERSGLAGQSRSLAYGLEWPDPPSARQDREDIRNLEAFLWLPADAMARLGERPPPEPSDRHRLQLKTNPQHPEPGAGTAADSSQTGEDGIPLQDKFLKTGDVVDIVSPQIGTLRTNITASEG